MEQGHNGWKNYKTWVVNLWMTNDEGMYHFFKEMAEETADTYDLSEKIKEFFEENNPLNELKSGPYHDLLNSALSEVDWYEIAESLREDCP